MGGTEGTLESWRRNVQAAPGFRWRVIRYAVGATIPVAVAALQATASGLFGTSRLFLFLTAVFLTAWLTGPRPAILSVLLSALMASWFFLPRHTGLFEGANLGLILFFGGVSALIIYLTARLQRFEREAESLSQTREEFLSAAAHELRTPLAALQLQVEAVDREARTRLGFEGAWLLERTARLRKSTGRLTGLIEVLMDITRVQAGKLQLDRAHVDLAEVARAVVARLSEEHATSSEVRVHADGPVIGRWDRARLDQVVTNLISNACKFGEGRPVEVKVAAGGGTAKLVVRDEGIGIAPEHTVRIFERFERATDNRRFEGMGVGLWIARQIVDAHGGRIHVDSEPGAGSTFTVELHQERA